jgi:hypothetical protein
MGVKFLKSFENRTEENFYAIRWPEICAWASWVSDTRYAIDPVKIFLTSKF